MILKEMTDEMQDCINETAQDNKNEGGFVVKSITLLSDLESGAVKGIEESDLTIQTDTAIIQMTHEDGAKNNRQTIIKPGCWVIEDGSLGTVLKPLELREYHLLDSVDNTAIILQESSKFFDRLHVYEELGKDDPKRAILLCSAPGTGKTAAINKVCKNFLAQEGTVVVVWDSSAVRSSSVSKFFLYNTKFSEDVKRFIFVMEDIGGGSVEDHHGSRGADSSMLNLLDGIGSPFKKIPTFIIATTNNPEQSVAALIDRPGRFDKIIELKTPNKEQCVLLLAFIAKKDTLNPEEIQAAELASKNQFSIAHLQEIVVRSKLDDVSILEATKQLIAHKERFKRAFAEEKRFGIGIL